MADFRFPPHCEELRTEVRAFLAAAMADVGDARDPGDLTGLQEDVERRLHRAAGERGWLDLDPAAQAVFNFEAAYADAPLIDTAMTLAGPAVAGNATLPHHHEVLDRMRAGTVTACIAYTEPGAGSDLSRIETTATPHRDGWMLRGTKSLVTGAHKADWCCTIARTDPDAPPRRAMSMFLVPMDATGIEVTRHETMNGWTLNEIRFHDVALGPEALLGEREAGWRQMATALAAERSGIFWLGFARHVLDLFLDHVLAATGADDRPRADDPIVIDAIGRLEAEWAAADRLARRVVWQAGREDPGDPADTDHAALASMAKIVATELLQDIARTTTELAGVDGIEWAPLSPGGRGHDETAGRFAWEYLERVHPTIGAGANEIQRDLVAGSLGLPPGGR